MLRDLLEKAARGGAVLLRNPGFRVRSLERRAHYWQRRGALWQRRARSETQGKRKRRLYRRSVAAFDRAKVLGKQARDLAEKYL